MTGEAAEANKTAVMPVASARVNLAQLPILIATFLPVEICVYYQVVPINVDGALIMLGMVDPNDLAAVDYVGKMLAFSKLQIQSLPLSFQEHQDLIAYYFSHPPSTEQLSTFKAAFSAGKDSETKAKPEPALVEPAAEVSAPESDGAVQQLLNSILRRILDEKADQLFVELNENRTCRIRYRQQGLLRDMFKELPEPTRAKLLIEMKQMVGLDPAAPAQKQSAEVERLYRGEPLVLKLRTVPQGDREGAILTVLQGDNLNRYQNQLNHKRVADTLVIAQQAQQVLDQLERSLNTTVEKVKTYSPNLNPAEWQNLAHTLTGLMQQARQLNRLQQDWSELGKASKSTDTKPESA